MIAKRFAQQTYNLLLLCLLSATLIYQEFFCILVSPYLCPVHAWGASSKLPDGFPDLSPHVAHSFFKSTVNLGLVHHRLPENLQILVNYCVSVRLGRLRRRYGGRFGRRIRRVRSIS